jgi:hypothetical protein
MIIKWEMTDTFGGEANYCWVKRGTIEAADDISNLAIMRRIKKEIGWNGYRCAVDNFGDMLAIRPTGICQVCFITFGE